MEEPSASVVPAADEGSCDAALTPEQHANLTVLMEEKRSEMKMKTSINVQSQRAACKRSLIKKNVSGTLKTELQHRARARLLLPSSPEWNRMFCSFLFKSNNYLKPFLMFFLKEFQIS